VTVPEGVDTKAMLPRAVTARVAYASGTGFYADGFGSRQMRLSYCYPTPERIREGVRRLAAVLESEMDLARTFGSVVSRQIQGPQNPSPDTV
jgi:DNA-binding transcriptional MocR family regulator